MLGRLIIVISLVGVCCISAPVSAQVLDPVIEESTGRVIAIKVTKDSASALTTQVDAPPVAPAVAAMDFISANKALLRVNNPETDLVALPINSDNLGHRQKYLQVYKGIPVVFGELSVYMNAAGEVVYVKTKIVDSLPASIVPKVSLKVASATGLKAAINESIGPKPKVSRAKLVILPLGLIMNAIETEAHLSWEIEVADRSSKAESKTSTYFIDATTGALLFTRPDHVNLQREVVDCAAEAGNACQMNGHTFSTCTSGVGEACENDILSPLFSPYVFGRSENKPSRGLYPNPSPVPFHPYYGTSEVDSMYSYLGAIHNYYNTAFGINGANGQGGTAAGSVDPRVTRAITNPDSGAGGGAGCPYNALFSKTTGSIYTCLGATSPDIAGHEYFHAVSFHSFPPGSGGAGSIGQSGSFDEGSADFMGELFELDYTGTTDWTNASILLWLNPQRNLANPPATPNLGNFGLPFPDRFYSYGFSCSIADSFGVHFNSTVPSHALYLIAQGGEENGCEIQGQGNNVARQILFRAWRNYFSQSLSFNEAYTDLIQACLDLYPSGVCSEVTKALQATELNQAGPCTSTPETPPACAQKNGGVIVSARPYGYWNSNLFAPGESIWIKGTSAIPNKSIDIKFVPHVDNRANWSDISSYPSAGFGTSGGDYFAPVTTATDPGKYDIIVDGNRDGYFQSWADSITTVDIKIPVDGDGSCYQGESLWTSENCMDSPLDCGCGTRYSCQNLACPGDISGRGPIYMCIFNRSYPLPGRRPKFCIAE